VCQSAGASPTGIPPSVRAALLVKARQEASSAHDPNPYDVEAVLTTEQGYLRLTCGKGCWSWIAPGTPVYVVAMRGRFSCGLCVGPPLGARRHRHRGTAQLTVITVAYLASGLGDNNPTAYGHEYPNLKAVGVPVRLDAPPSHRAA
jgi:hypothetical protein